MHRLSCEIFDERFMYILSHFVRIIERESAT